MALVRMKFEAQTICYLDNNATTRVAPEVLEAMLPFWREAWGNPSSGYTFGFQLRKHIQAAREQVAGLIGADPAEIVFTSCGTESNNAAIQSALATQPGKRHVVTTAVEHSSNIGFGKHLAAQGYDVTFLPVERDGLLDLHLLESAIRTDTAIVSIMWANNETGVIFQIEEIAAICQSKGVLFHSDAVQAAGKIPIHTHEIGVDFLSISAHKLYAPKGIGALYIRDGALFHPCVIGGKQERGRRAGTENVAYIAGFGKAAELAAKSLSSHSARLKELRDQLESGLLKRISGAYRNGGRDPRLPNTSNICFDGVEAEAILTMLDREGICVSSGSACTTGALAPSHVLTAMGLTPEQARGSIRFSVGTYNTQADIDYLLAKLPPIIARLRGQAEAETSAAPATAAAIT